MLKITTGLAVAGSIFAFSVGAMVPASAVSSACDGQHRHRALACPDTPPESASPSTREFAAQNNRPRVTIYPRRIYPGPNATRQCRSWLVTEYRVSGPVIVPRMRCWWE